MPCMSNTDLFNLKKLILSRYFLFHDMPICLCFTNKIIDLTSENILEKEGLVLDIITSHK